MARYYKDHPIVVAAATDSKDAEPQDAYKLSDFDKHRETLLSEDAEEGWASELRRYLGTVQRDIKKDTDLVEWWQVRF
jgi:hypothetical protein